MEASKILQLHFTSDMKIKELTLNEMEIIFNDISNIQNILYKTNEYSNPNDKSKLNAIQFAEEAAKKALENNEFVQTIVDSKTN